MRTAGPETEPRPRAFARMTSGSPTAPDKRRDRGAGSRGTTEHWIARFNTDGAPCGRVRLAEAFHADQQVSNRGRMVLTQAYPGHGAFRVLGVPSQMRRAPCQLRRRPRKAAATATRCCANWDIRRKRSPECVRRGCVADRPLGPLNPTLSPDGGEGVFHTLAACGRGGKGDDSNGRGRAWVRGRSISNTTR